VTRKIHGKRRKVKIKRQVSTARLVPGPVKFTLPLGAERNFDGVAPF
jgi:hypothetical protein